MLSNKTVLMQIWCDCTHWLCGSILNNEGLHWELWYSNKSADWHVKQNELFQVIFQIFSAATVNLLTKY